MSTLCRGHQWRYEEDRAAGGNMLQDYRECRRCGRRESRLVPTLNSSAHAVEDAEERGWLEWGEI